MIDLHPETASQLFARLSAGPKPAAAIDWVPSDRPTALQRLCRQLPPVLSARVFHTFIERRAQRAGQPFVARTITDALYRYHTGDALADKVRMCGYWDWRNLAVAATLCQAGDQIVEIGANTGTETIGFSRIVGPRGRVTAFEPEPTLLQALQSNVRLNGFSNVVTCAAAIADRAGSVSFSRPASLSNSGVGHIAAASDDVASAVVVSAITLDAIADDLGPASLISVDVEGYEVSVLRGAAGYLRRFRPALVLEVCPKLLARTGDDMSGLAAQLEALHYQSFEITKFGIRPVRAASCVGDYEANWLCLPREHADVSRAIRAMFLQCALTPNAGGIHPLSRIARDRCGRS